MAVEILASRAEIWVEIDRIAWSSCGFRAGSRRSLLESCASFVLYCARVVCKAEMSASEMIGVRDANFV